MRPRESVLVAAGSFTSKLDFTFVNDLVGVLGPLVVLPDVVVFPEVLESVLRKAGFRFTSLQIASAATAVANIAMLTVALSGEDTFSQVAGPAICTFVGLSPVDGL